MGGFLTLVGYRKEESSMVSGAVSAERASSGTGVDGGWTSVCSTGVSVSFGNNSIDGSVKSGGGSVGDTVNLERDENITCSQKIT